MENEQEFVATILKSMPEPDVPADFLARVNARIDETVGWLGLADFRLWTLRLAPVAAALVLVAVFWSPSSPKTAASDVSQTRGTTSTFSPGSPTDWQQDVSGDALLDAALSPRGGGSGR